MILPNKYDTWDKALLSLQRKDRELDKAIIDSAIFIPYDKPIRDGYIYKLVVIDSPKYRDNATLHAVVEATTDIFWVERKNNLNYNWKHIRGCKDIIDTLYPWRSKRSDRNSFDLKGYKLSLDYISEDKYTSLTNKYPLARQYLLHTFIKSKSDKHYHLVYVPNKAKLLGLVKPKFIKNYIYGRMVYDNTLIASQASIEDTLWRNRKNKHRLFKIKGWKKDVWEDHRQKICLKTTIGTAVDEALEYVAQNDIQCTRWRV